MNKYINNYNSSKSSSQLKGKDLERDCCAYRYKFNQNHSIYIHEFTLKIKITPISTNLLSQFEYFIIQLDCHAGGWVNM